MTQTLYRKYRPASFDEVVGQNHVTSVLKGAIAAGSVAHAYLFAGSRGTGKTSVARILARAIGTTDKDLYEIDAASNRGIDEIRALREAVMTMPFDSPKKVYIIDEAHMLTKDAFNAFLKTLEEPPPHVMFILATTEPHKLPDTVVSRCEVHRFNKPPISALREHVTTVAVKEGRKLAPESANLIAELAEGSFRDAQGLLQKVLTATGTNSSKRLDIPHDEVAEALGAPDRDLVNRVITALDTGMPEDGAVAIEEASKKGVSIGIFSTLLLEKLRAVLLFRHAPKLNADLREELGEKDFAFIEGIAKKKDSNITPDTLSVILSASERIGYSASPALQLEVALIEATVR